MRIDRFNPDPDPTAEYRIMFPFGDFRETKFGYQVTVEVGGEGEQVWFPNEEVFQALIAAARHTGTLVQVDRKGCATEGIAKRTTWAVQRPSAKRWLVWPKGNPGPCLDSSNLDAQAADPGPPGDEPPPPDTKAGPPVSAQERDASVRDGYAPNGSAPPRIARSIHENIALMDLALTNAVRLAHKHKPHVGHVDRIAEALFTAFAISGNRIPEDIAKKVIDELKKG